MKLATSRIWGPEDAKQLIVQHQDGVWGFSRSAAQDACHAAQPVAGIWLGAPVPLGNSEVGQLCCKPMTAASHRQSSGLHYHLLESQTARPSCSRGEKLVPNTCLDLAITTRGKGIVLVKKFCNEKMVFSINQECSWKASVAH